MRTTQSGLSVCNFTVAVARQYKDQNGERQTDFIPVIAWRNLAENCARYLAKGKKVCVVGEIQTRSYAAQDGSKRYVTELVASDVEFLTPNQSGQQGTPQGQIQEAMQGGHSEEFIPIVDEELPF